MPDLPLVLTTRDLMCPTNEVREAMVEIITAGWEAFDESGPSYNFAIEGDAAGFLEVLYARFFRLCHDALGPFTVRPDSSTTCWAYCNNAETKAPVMHHHLKSAHITGVYYLKIPRVSPLEGGLRFETRSGGIVRAGTAEDQLLVFDACTPHRPEQVSGHDLRIAINMELLVEDHRAVSRRFWTRKARP